MEHDDIPYTIIDLSSGSDQLIQVPTQESFIGQMVSAMEFFFGVGENTFPDLYPNRSDSSNFPFKGFILEGPPGSGKTEAVFEAGRRLWRHLGHQHDLDVILIHVDSGRINRSRFGQAETRLERVFRDAQTSTNNLTRTIILFDDIETLLIDRKDRTSQEWSRSLNGVFFHALDNLVTTKTMVVGTTNLSEMVDPAVRSRLVHRDAPAPTREEMKQVAQTALPIRGARGMTQEHLLELTSQSIDRHLDRGEPPSFRLALQTAIETVVSSVAGWDAGNG